MKKVLLLLLLVAAGVLVARRAAARHRATPHMHGTPDHWPAVVRNESAKADGTPRRSAPAGASRRKGPATTGAPEG